VILPRQLIADIRDLGSSEGARISRPGQWRVWREGGEVKAEIFQETKRL